MSLLLEVVASGPPLWRHWGGRLDLPVGLASLADTRRPLSFSPDIDVPVSAAPGFGIDWLGQPILTAHRSGRDFASRFDTCSVVERDGAIDLCLIDEVACLALDMSIALDPESDVLTLSASLANTGDETLDLSWLAAALLPLPDTSTTIRSFTGRHNAEFQEHREPMPAHGWVREERRGLTGHAGPPGLFVMGGGAGWHEGAVHAVQLAWSGNHRLAIERLAEGGWTLAAGAWLAPGEARLAPGERWHSPDLLATYSPDGLNGASANFHAAIRARSAWPGGVMAPRPVHLNSWESLYFDHDEKRLMALADRAAAIGVERFVLDDGWFTGRDDDRAGLGDWTPDRAKYPRGLGPLANHVVASGMQFGLWVEPEMVNPDSDLFRLHPHWALRIDGRAPLTARNQLVLDVSHQEVRDYLFGALDVLLRALPITYLKWDHNRHLMAAGGSAGQARYHTQVLGAYELIDKIRAEHPAVEIEACAGGGGRIDAGMATRTHRFWVSDNLDAVSRVAIQRGFLAFMPPERMGAHVGASPAHATGRTQALAFRAATALPGHFGVELDPATLDDPARAMLARWIAVYVSLRDRLHQGRTWLGEEADGVLWQAVGSPAHLLVFVTRIEPPAGRPGHIRLPMLRGAGTVRVRLIETASSGAANTGGGVFDRMAGDGEGYSGTWLAEAGLPLPPMSAESVAVFALEAV